MDNNRFDFDFKKVTLEFIKEASEQFKAEILEHIKNMPESEEYENLIKIIDIRYIQAVNLCTSIMNHYHKNLIYYLENNFQAKP